MEEKKRLSNQLIGSAGEYFVAGELARHGLVAALTVAGTDSFDILAVNNDTGETFAIQVKTTKDKDSTWLLSAKDEETKASHYVFVRLNGEALPEYYVVRAREVAQTIREGHELWMSTPGRDGAPRKETGLREFRIAEHDGRYYRRWDHFQGEGR